MAISVEANGHDEKYISLLFSIVIFVFIFTSLVVYLICGMNHSKSNLKESEP
jgi:hypothetical protein